MGLAIGYGDFAGPASSTPSWGRRRKYSEGQARAAPTKGTMTAGPVKLIECPRDAWQGLKGMIPADLKTDYLKALISAGFKHIDAVSFVSPQAVPQMADSEQVLKELDPPDDVEIIGIVVNQKGAQRAIATQAVSTLVTHKIVSSADRKMNGRLMPSTPIP